MAIDYTKLLDGNSLKAIKSYIDNNFVKSNSTSLIINYLIIALIINY